LITCSDVSTPAVAVSDPRPNQQRDTVAGLRLDFVVGRQPVALDDSAPGGQRALLVLSRKGDRAHFALELDRRIRGLMVRVQELTFLPGTGATLAEVEGLGPLRGRWKVQDLKAALFKKVAHQVHLMHPLHDHRDPHRGLIVAARKQG
jgi:hypothetical protein